MPWHTGLPSARLRRRGAAPRAGQRIERIVLPDSRAVSLVAEPGGDGACADLGLVGREGLLGLPALLGPPLAELRWLVRLGGVGRMIRVEALRARMLVSAALRGLVRRCASARLAEAGDAVACAALHPLARRLAVRLLALEDRLGPGFLPEPGGAGRDPERAAADGGHRAAAAAPRRPGPPRPGADRHRRPPRPRGAGLPPAMPRRGRSGGGCRRPASSGAPVRPWRARRPDDGEIARGVAG